MTKLVTSSIFAFEAAIWIK